MKIDHQLLIDGNNYLKKIKLEGVLTFRNERSHLVRAGRNQISLNISEESAKFFIKLQKGKKQVSGECVLKENTFNQLKQAIDELAHTLEFSPEIDHLTEIAPIAAGEFHDDHRDMNMLRMDTSIMVNTYKSAVEEFAHKNCDVSGAFSLGTYAYAIINTKSDKTISYSGSDFNVDVVVQLKEHNNKEIKAQSVGHSLAELNVEGLIEELKHHYKIKTTTHRKAIDLKKYDVVFGPEAIGELMAYTSWIGFSGEAYLMQTGMFQKGVHDLGQKVFGENITIIDDPESENTLFKRRIGLNGIERKKSTLIEKGYLRQLYYSNKDICDRFQVEVDNDMQVASLELLPGNGPKNWNEILESVERPTLYINTLHYMNFTNVAKGEFTATSRFGTYLLDKSKIAHHVYNVRVNDSFIRLFNNVEWLSNESTHINLASTYGMRMASSVSVPNWIMVRDVPITACFAPES